MGFNKLAISIIFLVMANTSLQASIIPTEMLIMSNYPESIHYPMNIFSQSITDTQLRYHYYHINQTKMPLKQELSVQNLSSMPVTINIQSTSCVGIDGSKCAHVNSQIFWTSILNNSKKTIHIPANGIKQLTPNTWLTKNKISHGILRIFNPNNHHLNIALDYKDTIYNKKPNNESAPIPYKANVVLPHKILPYNPKLVISIGKKDTDTYSYSNGNYGQIHHIKLKFFNPYEHSLESTIYYNRVGGMARNTLLIDEKLFTTKKVLFNNTPEKITKIIVPKHSMPIHDIVLFPESGNFYPIEIVVSSLKRSLNDA